MIKYNQLSLLDTIKGISPSELESFTRDYIIDHKFITTKDIGYAYLKAHYGIPSLHSERYKVLRILNYKLGKILPKLCNEGFIIKHNSRVYRRVE